MTSRMQTYVASCCCRPHCASNAAATRPRSDDSSPPRPAARTRAAVRRTALPSTPPRRPPSRPSSEAPSSGAELSVLARSDTSALSPLVASASVSDLLSDVLDVLLVVLDRGARRPTSTREERRAVPASLDCSTGGRQKGRKLDGHGEECGKALTRMQSVIRWPLRHATAP